MDFWDLPEHEYSFEYSNPNKSDTFLATEHMATFLQQFSTKMSNLTLKQSESDQIYELVGGLVNEMKLMNSSLIKD